MHPLHKLIMKKKQQGEHGLSPVEKKGKEDTLGHLINDMMDMDGSKVKGLKKVTVASNSPKGLEKGLDKAKEIIGHSPTGGIEDEEMPEHESPEMEEEESPEHEAEESPEMEESEHEEGYEEESPEEESDIEAQIEKLKEKLNKLKHK